MALDVDLFLSGVRTALEGNMKDPESPLILDNDFRVDISIYSGDYDKDSKTFTSKVSYVGIFPLILRD